MERREYMRRYMRKRRAERRKTVKDKDGVTLWVCEKCGHAFLPSMFPVKGKGRLYTCRKCSSQGSAAIDDDAAYLERLELESFLNPRR